MAFLCLWRHRYYHGISEHSGLAGKSKSLKNFVVPKLDLILYGRGRRVASQNLYSATPASTSRTACGINRDACLAGSIQNGGISCHMDSTYTISTIAFGGGRKGNSELFEHLKSRKREVPLPVLKRVVPRRQHLCPIRLHRIRRPNPGL